MLPELTELNRIRLDEDKTFGQLAAEIGLVDHSTLHRLLKTGRNPAERTLHKIRRYLEGRRLAEGRRNRSRGRKAVSAA